MTRPQNPKARAAFRAFLLLSVPAAFLGSPAQAQEREDVDGEAAIIGRVCIVAEGEGGCGERAEPGAGLTVRSPVGLEVVTDEQGRFHFPAVPSRSRAAAGDLPLVLLSHLPLVVDRHGLGPTAVVPDPVWVDLVPGGAASVELVVRLPEPPPAPPLLSGPETNRLPAVELREEEILFHVPVTLPEGHRLIMGGRTIAGPEEEEAMVPVPMAGREGSAILVDQAPDGRVRILHQRVLRVPRRRGGDLFSPGPLAELATIDLPPPSRYVQPGPLRARVHAKPGTVVELASGQRIRIGGGGEAIARAHVGGDGRLPVRVEAQGYPVALLEMTLPVRKRLVHHRLIAADLRTGATRERTFGEGALFAQTRLGVAGGSLVGGMELREEDLTRVMEGGALLAARRPVAIERALDP
ncbi:MAG: hypothetical protein ACOC0J_01270, partial [Myxococcota bacterium]